MKLSHQNSRNSLCLTLHRTNNDEVLSIIPTVSTPESPEPLCVKCVLLKPCVGAY